MFRPILFFLISAAFFFACDPQGIQSESSSLSSSSSSSSDPNYTAELTNKGSDEIAVLTLNLHTYQEPDPSAQMDKVAQTIADLDIDLIAFDECAQKSSAAVVSNIGGINIKSDNMALLIVDRLKQNYGLNYYFVWDWAHYGFSSWEEGEAILSKYPINNFYSAYISSSTSASDITSRKAVYGESQFPVFGTFSFVSTHLHWKTSTNDSEPISQVQNLKSIVTNRAASSNTVLVCGDFNSQPTETDPAWSETYLTMTNGYIDTFLVDNSNANNLPENSAYDTVKGDFPGRIDYIFMKEGAPFEVRHSEIIFTPTIIGTVSDHYGVITFLRKTN